MKSTSETIKEITTGPADAGQRIDVLLSRYLDGWTRSRAAKLISEGLVLMDGKTARAGNKVKAGSKLTVRIPEAKPASLEPEAIPLRIVYEDDCVIVVDKPPGMVVHPSAGHSTGTLVHALLHHGRSLSTTGGLERPGIVHRLDKDTSGLLIVAKDEQSHLALCRQLKERTLKRSYYAVVHGTFKEDSGTIETEIGRHPTDRKKMWINPKRGRMAATGFEVVERHPGFTLCRLSLKTGRTHQIRVHMACKGHPVVGDSVYGGKKKERHKGVDRLLIGRQALHAYKLGFLHPRDGRYLELESPLPEDIVALLEKIRN
ncbi:MAG: RluA family pseudouridine synthase [Nitrospinae bacterium]|nr:RluA family pseudouridine synthase [Nitrospinota bacterium]